MKKVPVLLLSLALAACGGGGGGGGESSITPDTSNVSVAVIDGAIKNATVCLDKNSNGACDTGEPSATSDVSGNAVLTVSNADKGQYPVVAVVGTDAIDADTGAVTTAYTMKAPKDQTAVVSPLTTLVQATVESTGVSTTVAAASVQSQTGLNISPFTNFTKDPDNADNKAAQIVANAVVVTTQQQSDTIKDAKGKKTDSGSTVTQADIDKLVAQKVMELLPRLLEAAADTTVQNAASPAARVKALEEKATAILATNGITSADAATAAIDINNQTASNNNSTYTPSAWVNLRNLTFFNTSNWFVRINSGTLAQDTPVNNVVKYQQSRFQRVEDADVYTWSTGSRPARGTDLHWNGSKWTQCDINQESTSTVRDSSGISTYNFCDGREKGTSQRSVSSSIADKKMIDVYNNLRAAGYTGISIGIGATSSAAELLGETTFPANSRLSYGAGTSTETAISYYAGSGNVVQLPDAKLAAADATACNASTNPASTTASTLDSLVATLRGTPCVFTTEQTFPGKDGVTLKSGTPRENWGDTSLSLGKIGSAPTYSDSNLASSFFTTNKLLRVAFDSNNVAKYYQCQERFNGSTRNCKPIGTGAYDIKTLGDSRVMTFSGVPAVAAAIDYTTVFVERGGKVYYGYQSRTGSFKNASLNTTATAALLEKLGIKSSISTLDPSVKLALKKLSYAASYSGTYTGSTDNGTFSATLNANGTSSCSVQSSTSTATSTCSVGAITPQSPDSTVADISLVVSNGSTITGTVNYYTGVVTGSWTNSTASGCTTTACTGTVTGLRR